MSDVSGGTKMARKNHLVPALAALTAIIVFSPLAALADNPPDPTAVKNIVALGLPVSEEQFEKSVMTGDLNALPLFFRAGYSPNGLADLGDDFVFNLAMQYNKRNLPEELALFRKAGLDFRKIDEAKGGVGTQLRRLFRRPITQEEDLLASASGHDVAASARDAPGSAHAPGQVKLLVDAGADPTTLMASLRDMKRARTLPPADEFYLTGLEAGVPDAKGSSPVAPFDASQLDIRGIRIGMTLDQVQAAAKATDMLLQVYGVSNRPGEQAIVVQDKTANFHSPSQVEMMNQRFAHIAGMPTSGSGLKMIVWLSSITHAVMEVEVRNAGIDESESDVGGVLYGVAVQKWGLPTGRGGSLGSGSNTDAATWGDLSGIHAGWHRFQYGDTPILDGVEDTIGQHYELDLVDPQASASSVAKSRRAVPAPKL